MKQLRFQAMMAIARNGLMRPIPRVHALSHRVRAEIGGRNVHVCDG
jgi:hypothetical protein